MMHLLNETSRLPFASLAAPTRRGFLQLSVGAGAGLALGVSLPLEANAATASTKAASAFNPFVEIMDDGTVRVVIKHLDKGQGPATGLATLVAEELDAAWEQMTVRFAPANAALYNNLLWGEVQGTGGSSAIPNSFDQYRQAGATARAMLLAAAADEWGVPADELTIAEGVISHGSEKWAGIGDFAMKAAEQPVPEDVALKTPEDWVYIGKSFPRLDTKMKSEGAVGVYGMDHQMDDMLVAALAVSPKFGGVVQSFDAEAAKAVRGVVDVIQVPQGVAVLATSTWPAIKARDLLDIQWDFSGAETRSSTDIMASYLALADEAGAPVKAVGDAEAGIAGAAGVVEATYQFPFLAHAPMEPIDVTVLFDGETATFWTGSQLQTLDQNIGASVLGIEPTKVSVETLWAGGSFGRRAIYNSHYVAEAAAIAKTWHEASGKAQPIKLVYTREDDIRGGYYRPAYVHKIRAGVTEDGKIAGWHHRIVGQSILKGTMFEAMLVHDGIDKTSVEGVEDTPYTIDNFSVELNTTDVQVPGLWWRSVGHTHTAYAMETMVDQLAKAAERDPVEFRRDMLSGDSRKLGVLNLVAEKSGWGEPVPAGRARGVAVHKSFNTYVAQVVEISQQDDGMIKVEKVWCAVDCGIAVNPDNIASQMEGGIGYGLGAILRNEITLTEGEVDQGNFDTYEPLRIEDMPDIEVHIVPSAEPPTGVGEPGTPPIGPAVANAIFAATGSMPTKLPLSQEGLV
ncbi:MAG: xanthine dehydrogenase family protein molybdopterin-binding subunit [Pseudomonadota bacterium]